MITMLHHQRYDNDNIMKSRKLFMMAPPRSQLHRGGGRKSCSRRQLVSPGLSFCSGQPRPIIAYCHHCHCRHYHCHQNYCPFFCASLQFAFIATLSGALPQRTLTHKNPTAAGALADDCQLLRQNPFMVCVASIIVVPILFHHCHVFQVGGQHRHQH